MSKLIVEMEMPKCCDDCDANYDCCACGISGALWFHNPRYKEFDSSKERLPDCPIVGVLPEEHGDLVDADTVLWEVPDSEGIVPPMPVTVGDVIEGYDVPIIIAAERKDDGTTAD